MFERSHFDAVYARTSILDTLRQREYRRLDTQGQVYLDYTGGGLYPESLVREHAELLSHTVLGNPHSQSPTSLASTHLVEQARADVLRYFRADPDEYLAIFTANASGALKLVGESYPFAEGSHFVLVADNHNSVHGIREFARRQGASIDYIPLDPTTLRAPGIEPVLEAGMNARHKLFAYPAQSNYSGVQHPLEWIELAQRCGYDVLLDAAAFVPSNRLDLSAVHPDFVPVSFYKMFGYPTGVGVLLARRKALAKCRRPWFGGGTVKIVSTKADLHILADGHEAYEDGTLNYLNLPAISRGLALMDEIGVETIHERVELLVGYLLDAMLRLRHDNGKALVEIYGPVGTGQRGCTIAFNLIDVSGVYIPFQQVEAEANQQQISIRAGCFCNPGAGEYSLTHTAEAVKRCVAAATSDGIFDIDAYHDCLGSKATGAVRVSLGMVSNKQDVDRFLVFLADFCNRRGDPSYAHAGC
ncbi:MAG: aminotransferase class V-fold PLP-dependent enzyme [Chloroflexi bacterium]|nr:aminotransferase class V-fold PLP-dependent enzyme [Chloroflexota bacterium]